MDPEPVNVRMDYGDHYHDLDDGDHDLDDGDLAADPLVQLQRWLDDAARTDQLVEPSAMALATVDADGRPALRTVLLRQITDGRLLFFSNYASRKADHLASRDQVALLFRWANPQRQVEVRGTAARAATGESDAYFASRPRDSQIASVASPQSRPLADRAELDAMVAQAAAALRDVHPIPRPEGWGGYAVTPWSVEFWQGRTSRLHDRVRYERHGDSTWTRTRLAP
ncbi:pyridoxamine 5'-phosphate oxidase [soil metagenome]